MKTKTLKDKNGNPIQIEQGQVRGLKEALANAGGGGTSGVEITYNELVALRNNSQLSVGTNYIITDYQCTTTQENTISANHQFDIIVVADSENTLNENARARLHKGDTYFANNKLNAWELKYSLDNDYKFAWADANGKGVVYYMKDEFNNECPYDFKNIMFVRKIKLENGYPELDEENGVETWVYTFTGTSYHLDNDEWSDLKDGSLESPLYHESDELDKSFYGNVIKSYIMVYDSADEDYTKCGKQYLNNIVMFGWWEEINSTSPDSYPYYYAKCCYNNTFGLNCYNNTLGVDCVSNKFGNDCRNNVLFLTCYNNKFNNDCRNNVLGEFCQRNKFGNDCYSNVLGNDCYNNVFGRACGANKFSWYCQNNIFENYCTSNVFSEYGLNNKLKSDCTGNVFGDHCMDNNLESVCQSNTFGNTIMNLNLTTNVSELTIMAEYGGRDFVTNVEKTASGQYIMWWYSDYLTKTGKYYQDINKIWIDIT